MRIRYLERRRERNGRIVYVWNCRHAKRFGMACERLGSELQPAIRRAEELNARYDAERARAPEAPAVVPGTLDWWLDQLEAAAAFKARPKKTQKEISAAFATLRSSPLGAFQLTAITGEDVEALHTALAAKSLDLASRVCKWLRWALVRAVLARQLPSNPTAGLRLAKPGPRQVIWTEAEVELAITVATNMGRASIALAIRLAYDLGQREGDVLRATRRQYLPETGEVVLTQRKTGATIRIPTLPELRASLDALAGDQLYLVLSETTGRPYKQFNFVHRVADVIAAAGLTGRRFSDLRRAAVVRLAEAGCTIPEIAAITGHSLQQVEKILEVYLPRTTPMARAAIQRLLDARKKRVDSPRESLQLRGVK